MKMLALPLFVTELVAGFVSMAQTMNQPTLPVIHLAVRDLSNGIVTEACVCLIVNAFIHLLPL